MMRTTLTLPDDVYEAAKSVATVKDISLGDAIAELVRQGLRPSVDIAIEDGIPTFVIPKGSPIVTLEHTLAIEDELD